MSDQTLQLATLTLADGQLSSAIGGADKQSLEASTLPAFLPGQRWFGAKDSVIRSVSLLPLGELEAGTHALAVADVALDAETQRYLLPLSAAWGDEAETRATRLTPALARIADGARSGVLLDSALDPGLARALFRAMQKGRRLQGPAGDVVFDGTPSLARMADPGSPRALGAEQSNVSIAFGDTVILKLYRRLRAGEQPDVEVARFLTEVGQYPHTPEFLGEIRYLPTDGAPTTLAAAFAFVANQGDAWTVVTEDLYRVFGTDGAPAQSSPAMSVGTLLGQRTAELHKSLAAPTDDPSFTVEPLTTDDIRTWSGEAVAEANSLLVRLEQGLPGLAPDARALAEEVLAVRDLLVGRLVAATRLVPSGGRSRIHGDYHLGQVLAVDGDYMIIDFEGEPRRSLEERRAKSSPIRDVAGMLRSFHYAAWTAVNRHRQSGTGDVAARAEAWRQEVSADFVRAYRQHIAGAPNYPEDEDFAQALMDLFLIQKAFYEVGYELANRPDWVQIPLSGVRDLLDEQ